MEFLKKISPYLHVLRIKNLGIITFTMLLLQYMVIGPIVEKELVLSPFLFFIFLIITLIIAGAGYLINDIKDHSIDVVNKPKKSYIPHQISFNNARLYYILLVTSGAILSIYIALTTKNLINLWIYPLVTFLLYMYAQKWKSTVLLGNIVVSLFVAFVWGILFYVQYSLRIFENTFFLAENDMVIGELLFSYFFFSFFINLSREIVKDIEDIEGDQLRGIKTYPIVKGVNLSKKLVFIILILLSILIGLWLTFSNITTAFEVRAYYIIFVWSPIVFILTKLVPAKLKKDFAYISKLHKWIMVFALFGMLILTKTILSGQHG
ncbi:MAG: UbiA family prenyltransferase [Saprospiraceae bacterium]